MKHVNQLLIVLILFSVLLSTDSAEHTHDIYPKIKINDAKEGVLLGEPDEEGYREIINNLHTNVHIDIKGMVSSTTVDQIFTNDSSSPIEATYVFPLPTDAAVNHMTMIINDRIIQGEIKEKVEAKKVYEKAKKEGKRASLTEQKRGKTQIYRSVKAKWSMKS